MDDHSKHCYMRQTVCTCGYENEREAAIAAKDAEIEKLKAALKQIAGESGQFGFPWPETHVDYPAFALLTARAALKGDAA